jgi:glutaconate CoA-transferase, subunit B
MKQSPRSFVPRLEFRTSWGYLGGSGARRSHGFPGAGPRAVITDLGVLRPHPHSEELQLVAVYPGVSVEAVRAATGWELQVAEELATLPPPASNELATLRELHARTRSAHNGPVRIDLSR